MGCHVIIIWLGVSKGMVPVKHLKQIMVELKAFGLPCHNSIVGGKQGHGPCETFKTNYGRDESILAAMS